LPSASATPRDAELQRPSHTRSTTPCVSALWQPLCWARAGLLAALKAGAHVGAAARAGGGAQRRPCWRWCMEALVVNALHSEIGAGTCTPVTRRGAGNVPLRRHVGAACRYFIALQAVPQLQCVQVGYGLGVRLQAQGNAPLAEDALRDIRTYARLLLRRLKVTHLCTIQTHWATDSAPFFKPTSLPPPAPLPH